MLNPDQQLIDNSTIDINYLDQLVDDLINNLNLLDQQPNDSSINNNSNQQPIDNSISNSNQQPTDNPTDNSIQQPNDDSINNVGKSKLPDRPDCSTISRRPRSPKGRAAPLGMRLHGNWPCPARSKSELGFSSRDNFNQQLKNNDNSIVGVISCKTNSKVFLCRKFARFRRASAGSNLESADDINHFVQQAVNKSIADVNYFNQQQTVNSISDIVNVDDSDTDQQLINNLVVPSTSVATMKLQPPTDDLIYDLIYDPTDDPTDPTDDPITNLQSQNDINYFIQKLMKKYKNKYCCASIKYNIWYAFKNHRWIKTNGIYLRNEIFDELINECNERQTYLSNLIKQKKGDDKKQCLNEAIRIAKVIVRLSNPKIKIDITQQCADIAYDPNFFENLDKNYHLICFTNGVYDLNTNEFRNGRPDDYISLCTNYEYVRYNKNDKNYKEIKIFLKKIQPDKAIRKYLLIVFSTCLAGSISDKTFYIFTGSETKSKIMGLMRCTLGDLFKSANIIESNDKRASSLTTFDLADKKGARVCVFDLPLMETHQKSLTGKQQLFEDNRGFLKKTGGSTRQILQNDPKKSQPTSLSPTLPMEIKQEDTSIRPLSRLTVSRRNHSKGIFSRTNSQPKGKSSRTDSHSTSRHASWQNSELPDRHASWQNSELPDRHASWQNSDLTDRHASWQSIPPTEYFAAPSKINKVCSDFVKIFASDNVIITKSSFEELIQFRPNCKTFLLCNHLPNIRLADDGLWKNIKVIFFPDEKNIKNDQYWADEYLSLKIFEYRKIFMAMLIKYYNKYSKNKWNIPELVILHTNNYRNIHIRKSGNYFGRNNFSENNFLPHIDKIDKPYRRKKSNFRRSQEFRKSFWHSTKLDKQDSYNRKSYTYMT
jgi:hypothetical protein